MTRNCGRLSSLLPMGILDKVCGIVTFKAWIGCQNNFARCTFGKTFQEFHQCEYLYGQCYLMAKEHHAQHMIQSFVHSCLFQGKYIQRLFDYTNGILITSRIGTDRASIIFSKVKTTRTVDDTLFDAHDGLARRRA